MTTIEIINRWNWNAAEIDTLNALGIDKIDEIFANMDDNTFGHIDLYFNAWLMGEAPKARLNYWLKKAGVTVEMVNIYFTT